MTIAERNMSSLLVQQLAMLPSLEEINDTYNSNNSDTFMTKSAPAYVQHGNWRYKSEITEIHDAYS